MLTISKKYLFFHPILWTLIGYMVWMLVPPFFTDEGHMWKLVPVDLIGFCSLCFGFYFGGAVKNTFIPNYKLTIRRENISALIFSFIVIIYCTRLYLFSKVGIYAFLHPFSRESSLIDTFARDLTWPYITLVTTLFILTKKKIYGTLLVLEFVFFIVPTMARSYYLLLILNIVFIRIFLFNFKFTKLINYLPVLVLMLVGIGFIGPYLHAVRSLAYVGKIEKAESISFESTKDDKFLINRLNVHGLAWSVKPVIDKAAELDRVALTGMLSKWFGFSKDYSIRPSEVSNIIGSMINKDIYKSSTDIPRNYVLMHYPIGALAVIVFSFFMGIVFAITYKILYVKNSLIFITLWIPFLYSPAFGGQGAMASAFIFQYLLIASSFVLLLIVFMVVKYLKRIRLHSHELLRAYSKEI